jgi:hypothetical protein
LTATILALLLLEIVLFGNIMFSCTVHLLGTERLHQILQTTHGSVRDVTSFVCFISAITVQLSVVESEFLRFSYNCLVDGT